MRFDFGMIFLPQHRIVPTLKRLPGQSVDLEGNPIEVITKGRHDPCVGIRATPIAEAMLAITLMDHLMRDKAQNGDVQSNTPVVPAAVK